MAATDKIQTSFRFLPDQLKRLAKAARLRGVSQNAFVESAVLREINEVEESRNRGRALVQEERQEQRQSKKIEQNVGSFSALTTALQHRNGLAAQEEAAAAGISPETPQQQGQVVVNVGNHTNNTSDIDRFASFVLAGNEFERSMRLQMCITILQETASTEEERHTLAAKLDEAIAIKLKKPPISTEGGFAANTARMAFDKIMSIIK